MGTQTFIIKEICSTCGGTGVQPSGHPGDPGVSCFMCGGTGSRETGAFVPEVELATQQIVSDQAIAISNVIRGELAAHQTAMLATVAALQRSVDQIAEVIKKTADICAKILEIVSGKPPTGPTPIN